MLDKLFIAIIFLSAGNAAAQDNHMRGWIEHARVMPDNLLMTAKLDSGARTTSIHAEILPFEGAGDVEADQALQILLDEIEADVMLMLGSKMIGGQPPDDPPGEEVDRIDDGVMSELMPGTIRFQLTSRGGKEVILTKPVSRWVSIRRRGGGSIVRPVVELELCIAGRRVAGEVNLADRSGFNYPLLIGRNMLSDANISVDSGQIFAAKKACPPSS